MIKYWTVIALLAFSIAGRGQSVSDAKDECETLMNEAVPFAEKMLRMHGEFYPYAYSMKPSGEIVLVGGYDGTDKPKSQVIIDALVAGLKADASAGKVKATAIVYDVLIVPPGSSVKSDAIAVALNHRDSYSVVVMLPYTLHNGELLIGTPFAQKSVFVIFVSALK